MDVLDFMTRITLLELGLTEQLLLSWQSQIERHLDEVCELSTRIRFPGPYQLNSREREKGERDLADLLKKEADIMNCMCGTYNRLNDTPVTPKDFKDFQKVLQEDAKKSPPNKHFLGYVFEYKEWLQELRRRQRMRLTFEERWQELDRREQLKQLEEEVLHIEALVKRPEFDKQLLEGPIQQTENCEAIKELDKNCWFLLRDCVRRLNSLRPSLQSLFDYVEENWPLQSATPQTMAA